MNLKIDSKRVIRRNQNRKRKKHCSDTYDRQNHSNIYNKIQTKQQKFREKKRRIVRSFNYQP